MRANKISKRTGILNQGFSLLNVLALCAAFIFAGCQDERETEISPAFNTSSESRIVRNGEVNQEEGFYFLAPIVKSTSYSGTFDASLSPVVEICSTPACEPPLHAAYTVDGSGPEKVRVNLEDEHYIVNWNTGSTGAAVGQTYRVRVKVNEQILGYFDVAIVSSGAQAKSVAPGLSALVAGQTLPIKFRIEGSDDDVQVPGRDIVVFNDVNIFDDQALLNPNNQRLVSNLVNFTSSGSRNNGTVVWFDCGRSSAFTNACSGSGFNTLRSSIQNSGFTLTNISSSEGTLLNIPSEVKTLFLWLPTVAYTAEEINTLKQFAAEGGRIIFIGEHEGFYGSGITVENQLLISLGAILRNTGGLVDCGYNDLPTASMRQHPITDGITNLTIACASVIEPGADDFALFYDQSNTRVLAGVAKIDVNPIAAQLVFTNAAKAMSIQTVDEYLNPKSPSGR